MVRALLKRDDDPDLRSPRAPQTIVNKYSVTRRTLPRLSVKECGDGSIRLIQEVVLLGHFGYSVYNILANPPKARTFGHAITDRSRRTFLWRCRNE